jgi:CheY-like chemotaxis protein
MKARILVVEDNELTRELLCHGLETESYQVTSAADLQQAFDEIKKQNSQRMQSCWMSD